MRKFYIKIITTTLVALVSVVAIAKGAVQSEVYTVLPLIFDKNYGYPSVVITIQGNKILVGFDLGAAKTQLSLSTEILKKRHTKVKYTGKVDHITSAQGIKFSQKQFTLPKVRLGNFVISDVKGTERTRPVGGKGGSKNGIVGLSILSQYNLIINFRDKKVFLIKGNTYPPGYDIDTWKKIPFSMTYGNVVANARIHDKKITLIWDTDAPLSLIKPSIKIAGKVTTCSKSVLFKLATTPTTCKAITTQFIMGKHTFGPLSFYTYPMPGLPTDGVIGDNFFNDYIVYINFSKKMMAIKKS